MDRPRTGHRTSIDSSGKPMDVAFVLAGFARMRGLIPPIHIGRMLDENEEGLGYEKLEGLNLLFNSEQEAAFSALPERFTFKVAKQSYGRQDQATSEFLKKCLRLGMLRKDEHGYSKT